MSRLSYVYGDICKGLRRATCALARSAALFAISAAAANAAFAAGLDQIQFFDIQAKTLDEALLQFGTQAHLQIGFASGTAALKLRARAVKGRFTARHALVLLLRGSDLTYEIQANTIEILTKASHDAVMQDPLEKRRDGSTDAQQRLRRVQKQQSVLSEITVTGTRIEGSAPVGVPLQTIDSVQIARSGYTNLGDLLASLPDNFRGGAAGASADSAFSQGANSGNNFAFGTGINLRGLGNDATLILLDGHRLSPSGSGYFTDISEIPLSAIDHIDILTDGASAIYGSDAIAGVVNIVLKQNAEGVDTAARYGVADGFTTYDGSITAGHDWGSGAAIFDGDYSGQGALDVRDRSYTASVQTPTAIYPMAHTVWLSASGHQTLPGSVALHGDVEYSEALRQGTYSYAMPATELISAAPQLSGEVGASYHVFNSWDITANVASGENTAKSNDNAISPGAAGLFQLAVREVSRFSQPTIGASGGLFPLPAGVVKLAVGSSYLLESFSHVNYGPGAFESYGASRHVASGYGELRVPVVSGLNATPGIRALTVSAAGRYDKYSDFGSTTNYKTGVSWSPIEAVSLRGAYSTSFRAPAVGNELYQSERGTTYALLYPIYNAALTGMIPVLFLEGGRPDLRPETARNLTVGFDVRPPSARQLDFSMNYYRIDYVGQLSTVPFSFTGLSNPAFASAITEFPSSAPIQALVNSAISNGAIYLDATGGQFGPDPLAATRYVYDIRLANLSRTDTSGLDLHVVDGVMLGENKFQASIDASYVLHFFTQLTEGAPSIEEVNTVGNPAALRITSQAVWSRGRSTIAVTGNFVNRYEDTTSPTLSYVGSYTTFDLAGRYVIGSSASTYIGLSVTDLFNRNPPFVANGALGFPGSHYDSANASPTGRLVSIDVGRHW